MSRDQRSLALYLDDVVQAAKNIQTYTADMSEARFLGSGITKDAVARNFEIIGEASRQIEKHYPEFVRLNRNLPLSDAYLMRNKIAHGYFKTDYEVVWETVQNDLPHFLAQIEAVRIGADLQGIDTTSSNPIFEEAKRRLQSLGISQEFQDAVIKQMQERLLLPKDSLPLNPKNDTRDR